MDFNPIFPFKNKMIYFCNLNSYDKSAIGLSALWVLARKEIAMIEEKKSFPRELSDELT